ncbi:MAG: DUF6390 family protein [Ktedonobacterales bacterium]
MSAASPALCDHLLVAAKGALASCVAPLRSGLSKLPLTQPHTMRALRQLDGLGFADDAQPGDYVSIHWNWVCEKLTPSALRRLNTNTRRYLALANETR